MIFQLYRVVHLLITGFITIVISTFVASGGIAENYTDNPFPNPQWLLPIFVWAIGFVLSFIKKTTVLGLIISSLPSMFYAILLVTAYFS
ncbi:MAG: hypothetical protein ACQEV0_09225 [Bacillota bacterium]